MCSLLNTVCNPGSLAETRKSPWLSSWIHFSKLYSRKLSFTLGHGCLHVYPSFKELTVWEGVVVNHWKSSIGSKTHKSRSCDTPVGRRQWRVLELCNNATSQYCNYSMPFRTRYLVRLPARQLDTTGEGGRFFQCRG